MLQKKKKIGSKKILKNANKRKGINEKNKKVLAKFQCSKFDAN